mgnify:CR=1 FL=1
MIDLSGTEVASYVYDSWGNIRSVTGDPILSELNPLRYRGYVYDEESELYYLQSRYYDPFVGRFLNADTYCQVLLVSKALGIAAGITSLVSAIASTLISNYKKIKV